MAIITMRLARVCANAAVIIVPMMFVMAVTAVAVIVLQAIDPLTGGIEFALQGTPFQAVEMTIAIEPVRQPCNVSVLSAEAFGLLARELAVAYALFDPPVLTVKALLEAVLTIAGIIIVACRGG